MLSEKTMEKYRDMLESKLKEIFKDAKHVELRVRDNEIEIAVYDLPFSKTYLNMFFKNLKVSTTMIKKDSGNAMLYINITFKTNVSETTINKVLPILKTYYEVVNSGSEY
ncbi:MAG: hypothetical protein QXP36_03785 [Conexivisphaerales archaeon]